MSRSARRAGLVEQLSERRCINGSSDPPGVIEQLRDYRERDRFSRVLPMRLPSEQHARKLAVCGPLSRQLDVRGLAVILQQWRLARLRQVALEQARALRRLEKLDILRGQMKAAVGEPIRPYTRQIRITMCCGRTLDDEKRILQQLAYAGADALWAVLR